jgi:hypothetical protein
MQKLGTKFITRDDEKCSSYPNFIFSLVVFDGLGLVCVCFNIGRGVHGFLSFGVWYVTNL